MEEYTEHWPNPVNTKRRQKVDNLSDIVLYDYDDITAKNTESTMTYQGEYEMLGLPLQERHSRPQISQTMKQRLISYNSM